MIAVETTTSLDNITNIIQEYYAFRQEHVQNNANNLLSHNNLYTTMLLIIKINLRIYLGSLIIKSCSSYIEQIELSIDPQLC